MLPQCFVVDIMNENQYFRFWFLKVTFIYLFLMHVMYIDGSLSVSFSWTQILKDNLAGGSVYFDPGVFFIFQIAELVWMWLF